MTEVSSAAALSLVRWQHTRRGYDGDADLLQTGFDLLQPDADGQFECATSHRTRLQPAMATTRRGYDGDADLLQTGFALLQPDADGQFGPQSALRRIELAFNLPWQRIASEVLQFAVFLVTKAKRDDTRPQQTQKALRLLQLALNAFAVQDDAQLATLPLNSCNLLLAALAETLEKIQEDEQTLQTLGDVKAVFLYLFGLPSERLSTSTASFHMYRPPTNVYADFLKRALTAVFKALKEQKEETQLYVDVLYAALFVFQELQKTQTNKKKVFLAIAKTSLRDIVAYRHALVTLQKQNVSGVEAVTKLLDRVVEDALFDAEHIRQYDGAMVHAAIWNKESNEKQEEQDDKKAKKRRKAGGAKASGLVSYQKNLFDELLSLLSDRELQPEMKASVGGFFEVLVRGFSTRIRKAANTKIEDTKTDLKTSRKRAAIVIATTSTTYSPFNFWAELCAVAYSAYQQETAKNDFLPVLVTLYNALFRALCECDVYRVTEDTEEREQFQTMEKVLSSFLDVLNVEHGNDVSRNIVRASEECEIVSSAVRCSPNLVNSCLVPIFELLGVQAVRSYPSNECDSKIQVIAAASNAVVSLIHAYDSMRLLDAFLKAAFAVQHAHDGLYNLFALPLCEGTLRKAFMALPPGQMDLLWNLLVEQLVFFATSKDTSQNAHRVATARLLFQTFIQEIHVVPQNRSKVLGLVSHTHDTLLSTFADELGQVTGSFSSYQRELFCIFGELLMFDSVLNTSIREQTFDQMFAKLEGDRFGKVMEQLLSIASSSTKKKRKNINDTKSSEVITNNASQGHGAIGIVKVCVYWLRKMGASNGVVGNDAKVSRKGREKVTRLVIEYVVSWNCWEAVSFHLPELMANASNEECGHFFRAILNGYIVSWNCWEAVSFHLPELLANASNVECGHFFRAILNGYINESVIGECAGSAGRTICDAGFYEITSLREIATSSLTTMVQQYVDELHEGSLSSLERPLHFFSFLLKFPASYLIPERCGELLATTLSLYNAISVTEGIANNKAEVCRILLAWIRLHFKAIGVETHKSLESCPKLNEQLRDGARFIMSQLVVDDAINVHLLAEVLGHYSSIGASAFVGQLLSSVLSNKNAKEKPTDKVETILKRAVIVVEALAVYQSTATEVSKEVTDFVESVVDVVTREKVCDATSDPLTFAVLTAFIKYQSVQHKHARQHKDNQSTVSEGRVLPLLTKHVGPVLASSMKLVVASCDSTDDVKLQDAAWSFFASFCEEYASFRAFTTPLETYGCILAVSLALVSRDVTELKHKKVDLALQAVVENANKDEFRLLLSTVVQELATSESKRKLSALRALCLLLGGDRKLSAPRRLLLNERKESIVEALLQNFTAQSLHGTDTMVVLRIWNLKAFVLVFCKAELFTWKTHELQHVFTGFQPLVAAVSYWQAGSNVYNPEELHELWTLSYTLLLRIVRNHFASLVNGIPHLIQAANALLQMLVMTSANTDYSKYCSEWSSNLARLYGYMKEHDVQLRKHVVYLLMTFLVGVTRDKLAVRFQQKLRPGVFALLDVCSPYEKEQLFGALDSTGKSLLKTLDTNYKLTHRYVGKV
ncbi:LOW QUALITY PROTEIN: hypothetical protein PHMEG_00012682 [Phytophthora megakarya]|uniref:Nucleolar 27S pre-rRNA processing Urb2/Npa2 C-terminal domain-containing protein n=1 Tax=Phytophthora megakarya TaxID=4795 RepID=A0A225W8L8_9STRA|nr:LOW QUALITY PROTEIN: hypothetical protein PHMEG_00012682 [Phytophthora megakarya]